MKNVELKKINNKSFIDANRIILDICKKQIKLSVKEIKLILNLKEKELVNSFFYEYGLFDQQDFIFIESFINSNLDNENKDFVSDLIYIALDFGLDLNYTKILSLIRIKKEDKELLALACLEYIHKNIKYLYLINIIDNLEYVRNNNIYYKNEQLLANLILFRITNKSEYLHHVRNLIKLDTDNLQFLENVLKQEMYHEKYFNQSNIKNILKITKNK